MYRHGDVIIMSIKAIPTDASRRPSAILARGEATGHSHRMADPASVELYDDAEAGVGYLVVHGESAMLVHDEHAPIKLPTGSYRFWQQREYSPKEIRRIVD
jgi:hypothetical protein